MNRLFRTAVVETSGVRTIAGGGTNASNAGQALLNLSGVSLVGDQTISGNINISGAFATSRSKTFVYSRTVTGGGNATTTIAYGANCRITPRHVGTVKAEACISMTCVSATSTDVQQAASFWYGTGTPPVYSGNLVSLNGNRIGGLKGFHASSAGAPQNTIFPVSASWVAEITGLATNTQYWFDIGMSGSRMRVQDIQLYIEENY